MPEQHCFTGQEGTFLPKNIWLDRSTETLLGSLPMWKMNAWHLPSKGEKLRSRTERQVTGTVWRGTDARVSCTAQPRGALDPLNTLLP